MSQGFNWNGNSIRFDGDDHEGIYGHVCQEVQYDRWGWSLTTHAEGRNEPAVMAEGSGKTKAEVMLACSTAYLNMTGRNKCQA